MSKQLSLFEYTVLDGVAKFGTTSDVCDYVADQLQLSETQREEKTLAGKAGYVNRFNRKVRWAQQTLKQAGYILAKERGNWYTTQKGQRLITRLSDNSEFAIAFKTQYGLALWGNSDHLVKLFKREIDLVITSPPYWLKVPRDYGNPVTEQAYIDWFVQRVDKWMQLLRDDGGSIIINLGDVWNEHEASLSLYKERLLLTLHDEFSLRLAQRFEWLNPAKPAVPIPYVADQRIRVKPSLETIWWLSPNPDKVNADNRKVLEAYQTSMQKLIAHGGMKQTAYRPSGHRVKQGAFAEDKGGRIPHNLIVSGPE